METIGWRGVEIYRTITSETVKSAGGITLDPSRWPVRPYPPRRALTCKLHNKKLVLVSFEMLDMLILRLMASVLIALCGVVDMVEKIMKTNEKILGFRRMSDTI